MADIVRYRCSGCGWIYDPRFGDAANEVARGVVFENLPAKFICGVCGCPKAKFVKHDVLGGKPEVKKPEVKKPEVAKVVAKKSAVTKAVVKKSVVAKPAAKKPEVKKAAVTKPVAKKTETKKKK